MSDLLDNNAVSDVSPFDEVSPGDNYFAADESGTGEITSTPTVPSSPTPPIEVEATKLQIIIVSPDGTMTIYDESGNITAEVADNAYSLWLSDNGALDKHFEHYSVSEALLLFIALGSLVGLISKIFKRRKL